jgi:hypothetical protein
MDRPIKGNATGKYDMTFIDPTNDISAYYGGMTELHDLVVPSKPFRNPIFRLSLSLEPTRR